MARRIPSTASPEWAELFTSFTHSAFRLETLQHYAEPAEAEAFARFRTGKEPDLDMSWWLGLAERHTAAGRKMSRVRVVAEPPSAYTRFEFVYFPAMAAAGDDIRVIPVAAGSSPAGLPRQDFWLFDEHDVWILEYDGDGMLLGGELLDDPQAVTEYLCWRDTALAQAIPVCDYLDIAPDSCRTS